MLKEIEERIAADYKKLASKFKTGKKKLREELARNKQVAIELKDNAQEALHDLKSGKVFTDDDAAQNFKNTLGDTLKAVGMTGIFLLPGGSVGLIALRKMLRTNAAKALHIENLLTLTIEEAEKHTSEESKEEKQSPDVKKDEKPGDVK
jgi:hypothetical protein